MQRFFVFMSVVLVSIGLQYCSTQPDAEEKAKRDAYMIEGADVISIAQGVLGSQLSKQLRDSGAIHALNYCNINALSLTDSAARISGKRVYRRTLKPRNLENMATGMEKNALKVFDYALEHGEDMHPLLQRNELDSSIYYYSPIIIQSMCLNCHGTRNNGLALETFEEIVKLYPKDKAFNYKVGEIRGMWVVEL